MSFSQAKKELKKIYKAQPKTFYCGCDIEWQSKKKLVPSTDNCGYAPRNEFTKKGNVNQRAQRIEWEHVVSAWEFGHQLQCWQNGGRKACKKIPQFKAMEGDLHNLVPAIGEVNGDRSNYRFRMIEGENRVYGSCDAEVDFKAKAFEPAPEIRGDIARTYFYFEQMYGLKISSQQKRLFSAWHKLDPVDKAECIIHEKKAQRQGWGNDFVSIDCTFTIK
ncbi:endonuclease [Pseudoalteromonas luteoviolacea]|nr:endonuclease [Pseudoalteromonas luteoviolacea]